MGCAFPPVYRSLINSELSPVVCVNGAENALELPPRWRHQHEFRSQKPQMTVVRPVNIWRQVDQCWSTRARNLMHGSFFFVLSFWFFFFFYFGSTTGALIIRCEVRAHTHTHGSCCRDSDVLCYLSGLSRVEGAGCGARPRQPSSDH